MVLFSGNSISKGNLSKSYLQYSGLFFFDCASTSIQAFYTVFLQSMGLGAAQVGLISAMNSAIAILAMPLLGAISDRLRSAKKVFISISLATAIIVPLVPLLSPLTVGPLLLVYVMFPLLCFFRYPSQSILDSWVMRNANQEGLSYGTMRLWGSVGYAVFALVLSTVIPNAGVQWAYFGYPLMSLPLLALTFTVRDTALQEKGKVAAKEKLHLGQLMKNYYFVTYLIFAVALCIPVQCSNTFMPYLLESIGVEPALFAAMAGVKALMEVIPLLLLGWLRKHFKMPYIIMAAGACYVVQLTLYSFANSFTQLVLISLLQGIGDGLFFASGSIYVFFLAPPRLKATAQSVNGAMNPAAGIIGNLLGGMLTARIGVQAFYFSAGCTICVALILFAGTFPLGRKLFKQVMPQAPSKPI